MNLRITRKQVDAEIAELREMAKRNSHVDVTVPISTIENKDPDEMVLVQGVWVATPWDGMRMSLVMVDDSTNSRYLMCETVHEVDCGIHRHEEYVEEIQMLEGRITDAMHNVVLNAGNRIKYPAGEPHRPVVAAGSRFIVIFRKVG